MKFTVTGIIGDLLILSAVFIVFYIYFPYLKAYIPSSPPKNVEKSFAIVIPKISAYAPIIPDVNPWDKSEYQDKLQKGVAQARGFADFGEEGTIFLFSHSSLPPWEMTRANTSFLRLGELKPGDQIIVYKFDRKYTYEVTLKNEVSPDSVQTVLENADTSQLILQTCTPVGSDLRRLLVYATEIPEN